MHVGAVIAGKYRVERLLGEGGMGSVFEATHVSLGQRVALKVLRTDGSARTRAEALARFEREAQIAATLPPDHVARVTDMGRTDAGEVYLVMELLRGRDLALELAEVGPLSIPLAVDYVLQASVGVADAHARGLVHRDLKPSNIFLTRQRNGEPLIKVLDFGLSKANQGDKDNLRLTRTLSRIGTPQYMAPEQVQSAKNVDARCDQHALGVVLFELLTGERPYKGTTLLHTALAICTETPPTPSASRPEIPAALDAAVLRALEKLPGDRFPDLAAFAEALGPYGGLRSGERIAAITSALQPEMPAETSAGLRRSGRSGLPELCASSSTDASRSNTETTHLRPLENDPGPHAAARPAARTGGARPLPPVATADDEVTSLLPHNPARPSDVAEPAHPVVRNGARRADVPGLAHPAGPSEAHAVDVAEPAGPMARNDRRPLAEAGEPAPASRSIAHHARPVDALGETIRLADDDEDAASVDEPTRQRSAAHELPQGPAAAEAHLRSPLTSPRSVFPKPVAIAPMVMLLVLVALALWLMQTRG
jgi:serine/threonine protein kinase